MDKSIEAMKLALAALENIVNSLATHDDEGMIEHAQQMIDARETIAAIKQVLAQPERKPLSDYVNSAGINANDSPHIVLEKLERAIEAEVKGLNNA